MNINARKDGKYLTFEFLDGKVVKFDLSNGSFIGKKGNPVKGLHSQLSGYTIEDVIESFEDEKYRQYLKYVHDITQYGCFYYNVGTFLKHVRNYLNLEQFFACGFTNMSITDNTIRFSEIPKRLIKICREKELKLTEELLKTYRNNQNLWGNLLESGDYEEFSIYELMIYRNRTNLERFNNLINVYNYKAKSLAVYIDNIMRFEGENYFYNVINNLYDYATMMSAISPKYEKYPRYLATTHNIAVRNYNRLKKEFEEDMFKNRIDESMEFTYKNWVVIYPKSTQEIKDEAVQQNNCVASYIDGVIEGKCHILFLRHREDKNKSVVTIEVKENRVVQQKGRFNRDTNEDEKMVLSKYEDFLNKNYKKECA